MFISRFWIWTSLGLAAIVGAASGLASAVFLVVLAWATEGQTDHPWLLYFLPLAGVAIAWAYTDIGQSAAGGNNLLIDQLHATDEVNRVPLRMLPLVLVATILTHLCGGSAGREGTAVQMGGAIGGWLSRVLHLSMPQLRTMLMCGVSGGFAGVFGTPLAGTVFAMEMLALGGMRYGALIPCLVAAVMSDLVVRQLDVHHSVYVLQAGIPAISLSTVLLVVVAGVAFGIASLGFAELTATIERLSKQAIRHPLWRTFAGGVVVIVITLMLGTRAYNGLSLPLLADSFVGAPIPTFAFAFKLLLTAVTLGFGFKGGEVTPLFVIGATLGVTLASPLGLPADFLAALGFVAVFAAAANTPIACVVMATEIFGGSGILYFGIAIFVAYTISGNHGIYHSQRMVEPKYLQSATPFENIPLSQIPRRQWRKGLRQQNAAAHETMDE
jgi:H+/Cl- antiporter ClcA